MKEYGNKSLPQCNVDALDPSLLMKPFVPVPADLESQVQDLQEANETAVAELSNTERKVEELQRAKETLRLGQGSQNLDLQEENQRLHDQVLIWNRISQLVA